MISKVINDKEYILLEVPEEAHSFVLDEDQDIWYKSTHPKLKHLLEFDAPDGYWEIIGRASELAEEQWKGVARELPVGKRWENKGDYPIWFHTAKESGLSILNSLNLKPETTLIILKQ